jgi:hypothetical protein
VSLTSFISFFFCTILVAVILSMFNRLLIALIQAAFASVFVCIFPCITLSHLIIQVRYDASAMRMQRSLVTPPLQALHWFVSESLLIFSNPHPIVVPKFIRGHVSS